MSYTGDDIIRVEKEIREQKKKVDRTKKIYGKSSLEFAEEYEILLELRDYHKHICLHCE